MDLVNGGAVGQDRRAVPTPASAAIVEAEREAAPRTMAFVRLRTGT